MNEETYIKVEDKKGGGWLVIRISAESNDIIARVHTKFWAQDIVTAMTHEYGPGRDGLG